MRLLCCESSLLSSRSTWADSSICQAMPLQCIFEWNGLLLPAADTFEGAFGSVEVFEIVQVLEDGLADIEVLVRPVRRGSFLRRFSVGGGSRMASMATSLYKYSTRLTGRHRAFVAGASRGAPIPLSANTSGLSVNGWSRG